MSPRFFSCIICGYVIYDFKNPNAVSWLNQFRTLYSSPSGTWVSGVGLYNDPNTGKWIAPPDYEARWDDLGYDFPDHHQIGVMKQRPINDRHGFVFHEACWSLLQKSWDPEEVPYERLLDVCESLPFPLQGTGVSWGHDFGGLAVLDNQDQFPWEDKLTERDDDSEPCQSARKDPYHVPAIQQLIRETAQRPSSEKEMNSSKMSTVREETFNRLPPEICHMIATFLSTADYLSLRAASRTFAPIFSSQQFWASRFDINHDRYWLFEASKNRESRDWKLLYHLTNEAHIPSEALNRKRVWKLIQQLNGLLSLRWSESSKPSPKRLNPNQPLWREIAGNLMPETTAGKTYHDFNEGCRLFRKHHVVVPAPVSQIALSIVGLGDVEYIAGMQFISDQGTHSYLGYQSPEKELFIDVTVLQGFNLAIGSRGVQAVQAVTGEKLVSRWVGCPNECPKTQFLATSRPVRALEAGFDGFKMVSLGICDPIPSGSELPQRQSISLRDTALWYPEVPEPQLYLSDDYSKGEGRSTVEYQPLFWILFGGIGGAYLRFVTGISVTWLGTLRGIEFHYTNDAPIESRKLGRFKYTQYAKVAHFPIDGPDGEIIDSIDINLEYSDSELAYSFCKYGVLRSFTISTNRGRSCFFGPQQSSTDNTMVKHLTIAPGTTVTGLYASQYVEMNLISLGAISEIIVENEKGKEA